MVENRVLANNLMNKGRFNAYRGEFSKAITAFESAIEIAPNLFSTWKTMGDFLCEYSRYSEALKLYEKLLQLQPENVNGWVEKALILEAMKRYKDADEVYNEALKLQPDSHDLRNRKNSNMNNIESFQSKSTWNITKKKPTMRLGSKTVTISETGEILEIDDS